MLRCPVIIPYVAINREEKKQKKNTLTCQGRYHAFAIRRKFVIPSLEIKTVPTTLESFEKVFNTEIPIYINM